MADGIIRICNQHQMELRLIGADLVCPHGHACPVDWSVKTLPYADPRTRICPIHGKRLGGAGEILDCEEYGHQVSIREADRPRPHAPVIAPAPKPGDRIPLAPVRPAPSLPSPAESTATTQPKRPAEPMKASRPQPRSEEMPGPRVELKPHGTHQRYYQKCRCQPCKDAVAKHVRAGKLARLKAEGKPLPKPRAGRESRVSRGRRAKVALARLERPGTFRSPAIRRRAIDVEVLPATRGGDLETKVLHLRSELATAERAYFEHVKTFLPGVAMGEAGDK